VGASLTIVVTKLDRLARSVHHLLTVAKELDALGVNLVVLDQVIHSTMPSRRLLFHVLASVAEFERDLIRGRVVAGMKRAKAPGRHLGRPRSDTIDPAQVRCLLADGLSLSRSAGGLGSTRGWSRRPSTRVAPGCLANLRQSRSPERRFRPSRRRTLVTHRAVGETS
jgi:DNA invertase Pin-like site-specific DNA recombinase